MISLNDFLIVSGETVECMVGLAIGVLLVEKALGSAAGTTPRDRIAPKQPHCRRPQLLRRIDRAHSVGNVDGTSSSASTMTERSQRHPSRAVRTLVHLTATPSPMRWPSPCGRT